MIADDFGRSLVANPVARAFHDYFNWNARFIAQVIAMAFLRLPGVVFDIVNSSVYMLFILLLLFLSSNPRTRIFTIPKLLLSNFLSWIFIVNVGQTFLWLMGAAHYLWIVTIILISLVPLKLYETYPNCLTRLPKPVLYLVMAVIGLLAGFGIENTSFATLVIYGVWLLLRQVRWDRGTCRGVRLSWRHDRPFPYFTIPLLTAHLVGYITMLLSPGARVRGELFVQSTLSQRIMVNGTRITDGLFENNFYWLLLIFVVFFAISYYAGLHYRALTALVIFAAGVMTLYILMATPIGVAAEPGRAWFGPTVLIILAILYLFSLDDRRIGVASLVLLLATGLVFTQRTITGVREIRSTNQRIAQRSDWVAYQRHAGNLFPIVPIIQSNSPFWGGFRLDDIQRDDGNDWINVPWAQLNAVEQVFAVNQGLFDRIYRNGDPQWMRIQSATEYLNKLAATDSEIYAVITGHGNDPIFTALINNPELANWDLPQTQTWTYTAVIGPGGEFLFKSDDNVVNFDFWVGGVNITADTRFTEEFPELNSAAVWHFGDNLSREMEGLNIVVFDQLGQVLDSVAFNVANDDYLPYRLDVGRYLSRQ